MKLKVLGIDSPHGTVTHNCPGYLITEWRANNRVTKNSRKKRRYEIISYFLLFWQLEIVKISVPIDMELPAGIEPATSALPRLHSTDWAMKAFSLYI